MQWIGFVYRTSYDKSKKTFYNSINGFLDRITRAYENILINEDMRVDFSDKEKDSNNRLSGLYDIFLVKRLISGKPGVQSYGAIDRCNAYQKVKEFLLK